MSKMSIAQKNAIDIMVVRNELKYLITHNEYIMLSNLLRKFLKPDAHNSLGSKGYFVRSLYFDTLDNKSFEEKMAGLEEKAKYRLRIYDINMKWVKFEIKNKINNSTRKETAIISRQDAVEIQKGNFDVMLSYNDNVLNKAYKEFKKKHYFPVVIVDYFREAYTYDISRIRIVFDKFLKSTTLQLDLFEKHAFTLQRIENGLVIMELKYHNFIPAWLKHFLQMPSFERSAISKYCISRIDNFGSIV